MSKPPSGHALRNLHRRALLIDEELADQVWEAWDAQILNDGAACIAWMLIVGSACTRLDKPEDGPLHPLKQTLS